MQKLTVSFQHSHQRSSIGLSLLLGLATLMYGCSSEKKPIAEAPPPAPVAPSDQPQQVAKLPPPELNKVQEAVKRVFKDAVVIDNRHTPSFIVADFNGDLSEDLAVVVKPVADKVAELNEEYPAWILRDPFGRAESKGPRLRIAADDALLAIIHGYGAQGWRNPEASQTFLLKNAAASGMEAQRLKEFTATHQGKALPSLRGDVIGETVDAKPGYLYYAGASYSWYDPRTFKGDTEPAAVFHGRAAKVIKTVPPQE
jgi:hypothetical protein